MSLHSTAAECIDHRTILGPTFPQSRCKVAEIHGPVRWTVTVAPRGSAPPGSAFVTVSFRTRPDARLSNRQLIKSLASQAVLPCFDELAISVANISSRRNRVSTPSAK